MGVHSHQLFVWSILFAVFGLPCVVLVRQSLLFLAARGIQYFKEEDSWPVEVNDRSVQPVVWVGLLELLEFCHSTPLTGILWHGGSQT